MGVPKQYFGFTGDGAGFNGGQSLSIISSVYAKDVIRIQGVFCQLVADILNILFLDNGLDSYVNAFSVRMQAPVTQDDIDRRQNNDSRIRYVSDVSNLLSGSLSQLALLKIQKQMLTPIVNDPEVIKIIDEEIRRMEEEEAEGEGPKGEGKAPRRSPSGEGAEPRPEPEPAIAPEEPPEAPPVLGGAEEAEAQATEIAPAGEPESYMPSFSELGVSGLGGQGE